MNSPTAQTIDGIVIDLNLVSRLAFREFLRLLGEAGEAGGDELTGDFIERVVIGWPFGEVITKDAYLNLGLLDSARVDSALNEAMEIISKKKSSSLPKPPENSNGSSVQSLSTEQTPHALQNTNMSG